MISHSQAKPFVRLLLNIRSNAKIFHRSLNWNESVIIEIYKYSICVYIYKYLNQYCAYFISSTYIIYQFWIIFNFTNVNFLDFAEGSSVTLKNI